MTGPLHLIHEWASQLRTLVSGQSRHANHSLDIFGSNRVRWLCTVLASSWVTGRWSPHSHGQCPSQGYTLLEPAHDSGKFISQKLNFSAAAERRSTCGSSFWKIVTSTRPSTSRGLPTFRKSVLPPSSEWSPATSLHGVTSLSLGLCALARS
jgi:hypothetical protein